MNTISIAAKTIFIISLLMTSCKNVNIKEKEIKFQSNDFILEGTISYPEDSAGKKLPAFILVHGSGPNDRNETIKGSIPPYQPFKKIAHYLSKKGAIVLRYDKRSYIMLKNKVKEKEFSKILPDHFINDARSAFNFIKTIPEVDTKRIMLIGHSQGASLSPHIAKDLPFYKTFLIAPGLLRTDSLIRYQIKYQISYIEKNSYLPGSKDNLKLLKDYQGKFEKCFDRINDTAVSNNTNLCGASKKFWLREFQLSNNLPEKIASMQQPVIILQGERDLKCPVEILRKKSNILKKKSDLKIFYISNMTHELNIFLTSFFDNDVVEHIWENWK